ncbi:MAG: sugar phosphate isomerase/epimerase family protein [Thermodesulfobacteriota bacterium]|nr:sugar phosphate isomerase/epimerase family protein [Thermodesulfobacteriota bacterium]
MKISICNVLFQGWPIERVFEYAAGLGYDGVEIAPFTLADSVTEISPKRRSAIRRAAEENGIEIVGLHWLLMKPEGLYINHPDEFIRIQTQEYIEALIHFCADIGGKVLIHGSPHQRTIKEEWNFRESWEFAKETFKVCLKTARQRNVIYCIEPLTHANTNFVNTVEQAIRLVQEIRHPNFKMVFDCRNASAEERSVTESLLRALESGFLRHIHINDANGRGPGFGKTKFTPILKTLVKNGYKGYLSIEVSNFDPDPQTIACRSLGYLRGILESLG